MDFMVSTGRVVHNWWPSNGLSSDIREYSCVLEISMMLIRRVCSFKVWCSYIKSVLSNNIVRNLQIFCASLY